MQRLEVPLQLSGVHVERDDRVGEEVRALARGAVVVGRRVRHVDVHDSQRGIDRGRAPDAATLSIRAAPRALCQLPAIVLRTLRNRAKDPFHPAGRAVDGRHQPASDQALGGGQAHEQRPVRVRRRRRHEVAECLGIEVRRVLTGVFEVEGRACRVQHTSRALEGGDRRPSGGVDAAVAIRRAAAAAREFLRRRLGPQLLPRCAVDSDQRLSGVHVHDAAYDDWRGAADRGRFLQVELPFDRQRARIRRGDLFER